MTRDIFGAWVLGLVAIFAMDAWAAIAQDSTAFTVANYPVQAVAKDAVTAKGRAVSDGKTAAFRSLLKRIVPVTQYARLKELNDVDARDYVSGMSVRSEQNSSTEYLATYDFSFNADAMRELLRRYGLPFIDQAAPVVTVVPVYRAVSGAKPAAGLGNWGETWSSLDLANTITPVRLSALRGSVSGDLLKSLESGDASVLRSISSEYGTGPIVFAFAERDSKARRLNTLLVGRDSSGPIVLKRNYPLAPGELDYALEYAAVISLGIFEGRWKATRANSRGGVAALSGQAVPLSVQVQFDNVGDWYQIQDRLRATNGVSDFNVGAVSARSANLSLRFPGGGVQLANVLARSGLSMRDIGGVWVLRPSY